MNPTEQINTYLNWLFSHGVNQLDIAVGRWTEDGRKGVFLDPSRTKASKLNSDDVMKRLSWLRYENSEGGDVYVRPHRHKAWPLIFFDDVATPRAKSIAIKYSAAIIETSPNRCHVWLHCSQELSERQRYLVQKNLAVKVGADLGSISGEHWGRLPGFRNKKPSRDCWSNLIACSDVKPYDAAILLREIDTQQEVASISTCEGPVLNITESVSKSPKSLRDESRAEWGWVLGALRNGKTPDTVIDELITQCEGRRHADAQRYAEHTVQRACKFLQLTSIRK